MINLRNQLLKNTSWDSKISEKLRKITYQLILVFNLWLYKFSFIVIPSFWTLTDFKDRNIKLIGLVCHHKISGQLFNCMHTVSLLTWLYLIIGWLIWHMLCYMMSPHLLYCFLKCGLVTKMLFSYYSKTTARPKKNVVI